jgi:hypothetical protein
MSKQINRLNESTLIVLTLTHELILLDAGEASVSQRIKLSDLEIVSHSKFAENRADLLFRSFQNSCSYFDGKLYLLVCSVNFIMYLFI